MELAEKLEAIEEIKQLKARYFRVVDTKHFKEVEELFTPDGWFDAAESFKDPVLGQMPGTAPMETWKTNVGIAQAFAVGLKDVQTVHMGHLCEVEILSDTAARSIIPFNDRLRSTDGSFACNAYGYYHETYEKTDGKWRIKTSTLQRLRVAFGE